MDIRLKQEDFDDKGNIRAGALLYFFQEAAAEHADLLGVGFERAEVVSAGGILITPLPGCSQDALEQIERTLSQLRPVSELAQFYQSLE